MEGAFFVSKTEILFWLNQLLKVSLSLNISIFELNVTRIEEYASGAVYCQIIDALNPGSVQMSKVNWKAKTDYEILNNYKIL